MVKFLFSVHTKQSKAIGRAEPGQWIFQPGHAATVEFCLIILGCKKHRLGTRALDIDHIWSKKQTWVIKLAIGSDISYENGNSIGTGTI